MNLPPTSVRMPRDGLRPVDALVAGLECWAARTSVWEDEGAALLLALVVVVPARLVGCAAGMLTEEDEEEASPVAAAGAIDGLLA